MDEFELQKLCNYYSMKENAFANSRHCRCSTRLFSENILITIKDKKKITIKPHFIGSQPYRQPKGIHNIILKAESF